MAKHKKQMNKSENIQHKSYVAVEQDNTKF